MNESTNNPPVQTPMRLNRYLAQCGLGSRRACDAIIAGGHVMVNGAAVRELGTKIDPAKDRVEYGGKSVRNLQPLQYYAYHKSRGSVVSMDDPEGRETIYDALRKIDFDAKHLKYVGRLDRNSEGLLLLTNDGDIIHSLTHPRFQIKKVYCVKTETVLPKADIDRLIDAGIESEGQLLHAGAVRFLHERSASGEYWYEVDLYEGKNRQIRRMFEALGHDVKRLKRIQYGVITLGDLPRGKIRPLAPREISGLLKLGFPVKKERGGGGGVTKVRKERPRGTRRMSREGAGDLG
jgi:23S rRNA pseudouridine2605 synthase